MQTAVELSAYPLMDNYLDAIKWLIHQFDDEPGIVRKTNGMSTQLQGEHDLVMGKVTQLLAAAYDKWGRSVFILKVIPGGVNLDHAE